VKIPLDDKGSTGLEIVFDPVEEAVHSGLLMDESHELLPDSQWIRFARKVTGREDLFVYRHRLTEKFVLASWLFKEPRICLELEVMDLPPDRGGWVDTEFLCQRCRPAGELYKERFLRRKQEQRRKRYLQEQRGQERKEKAQYFKNKGKDEIAASVGKGGGPWMGEEEGGDHLLETKDRLMHLNRRVFQVP
jgi:hypothetical protein